MVPIDQSIVEIDHKLEQAKDKASQKLAHHRWHWTLDPNNPNRVSVREYASRVGRHRRVIGASANGYASWMAAGGAASAASLSEHIERAKVGEEREAVIDAVAKEQKVSFKTARQLYATDIAHIHERAKTKAVRNDSTALDELPAVMEDRAKMAEGEKDSNAYAKKTRETIKPDLERHLVQARRWLSFGVKELAENLELTDDQRGDIVALVTDCRDMLSLIDSAMTGESRTDWDAEFARLTGGESR